MRDYVSNTGARRRPDQGRSGDDLHPDAARDEGGDFRGCDGRWQDVLAWDAAPAAGLAVGCVAGESPVAAAGLLLAGRGAGNINTVALAGHQTCIIIKALCAVEKRAAVAGVAVLESRQQVPTR